jgi:hypothetical protein
LIHNTGLKNVPTCSNNVLVLQRNTLWSARRARGVHDTAEILRLWWDILNVVLLAQLSQVFETYDGQVFVGFVELLDVVLVDSIVTVPNNILDILGLVKWVDQRGKKMGIKEDGLGRSCHQRVLQANLAQSVVGGDNGH